MMLEPGRVAECVAAMRETVAVPVTVKTRLGVDEHDDYAFVRGFVARVAAAGCETFVVHARKAWLKGLSPKQNREIPPLDYARVHRLKREFAGLRIVINGGLTTTGAALEQLAHVDGGLYFNSYSTDIGKHKLCLSRKIDKNAFYHENKLL